MKTKLILTAFCACTLFLQGCYFAPVKPPQGIIYTNISAPIDTDADETPVMSAGGSAKSMAILGLIATGDASITAAAEDGNLSRVDHVDYTYFNILGVYQSFATHAYGE